MPGIRPLETLHNALSLRQVDSFLGYVTSTNFKTPSPSPAHKGGTSPFYQRPGDVSSGGEGSLTDRFAPGTVGMVSRNSSSEFAVDSLQLDGDLAGCKYRKTV